jgi:beta-glucanase (GH16 family)
MKKATLIAAAGACFIISLAPASAGARIRPEPSWDLKGNFTLIFDDEFNGSTLNSRYWTPGWFGTGITPPVNSSQLAAYNSGNVSVRNGTLNLTLRKSPVTADGVRYPYTGALVDTDGKFSFTYGLVEWRAYIPAAPKGKVADWPALWADGQTWPQDGELDVLEGLGGETATYFHSANNGGGGGSIKGSHAGWHNFGADWQPGKVTYYYDGKNVRTISNGITGAPMYLIMADTIASSSVFSAAYPVTMKISWVRVWKRLLIDVPAAAPGPVHVLVGVARKPATAS